MPDCKDCKYWSFDMDMEPFCVHPNAHPWGTDINMMRSTREPIHAREHCGPDAKFFEERNPCR